MLKSYLSSIAIKPLGNRCSVTWSCEFEMVGVPEEQAVGMVSQSYVQFLERLSESVGGL